jgi:predicted nucleic acid-binding protein
VATGLTLDTGALIALERKRKGMRDVVDAALHGKVSITVSSNSIAEWWRGRTDGREFVRDMFVVKDVDEEIAKLAGEALAKLKRRKADVDDKVTVDATVIATAALYGPYLYTGDIEDMQRLQAFFPSVRLFGLNPSA